jgi:hypothetical protein
MQQDIVEGILGPHEVGVMFAIFLFGLVTIQTFTYYQKYSRDAIGLKALVSNIRSYRSTIFEHLIRS